MKRLQFALIGHVLANGQSLGEGMLICRHVVVGQLCGFSIQTPDTNKILSRMIHY